MSTYESAGSCWCYQPDLRVLLTSAVVREQPFLHIPGAVEDNCCGLWEGEALKKHFQPTPVAQVFTSLRVLVQTQEQGPSHPHGGSVVLLCSSIPFKCSIYSQGERMLSIERNGVWECCTDARLLIEHFQVSFELTLSSLAVFSRNALHLYSNHCALKEAHCLPASHYVIYM